MLHTIGIVLKFISITGIKLKVLYILNRYLVTEGQITPLFVLTIFTMQLIKIYNSIVLKRSIDQNGQFLLVTFQITMILVSIWCYYWWNDIELRKKYPGLIYVPEPWSVYSLHFKNYYSLF